MYSSIEKIVRDYARDKYIYGIVLCVQNKSNTIHCVESVGYLTSESPYYIASINKLMISALALQQVHEGRLSLSAKAVDLLGKEYGQMLQYRGSNVSDRVTVKHLISHTSGFPCYLIDKDHAGRLNMQALLQGRNESWPLDKVLEEMKARGARFPPGLRAHYSETNFRLLANILQIITGKRVEELLKDMFARLGMHHSFVLPGGDNCSVVRYKMDFVPLNRYWESTKADVASTAVDQMLFLRAFFEGYFFPEEKLQDLREWKKIFFPYEYGVGLQRLRLPGVFSPFSKMPSIEGHCGSAGSFAFCIDHEFYVTGTINQAAKPNIAVQLVLKLSRELRKIKEIAA